MPNVRFARLLRLLTLLRAETARTPKSIAEELEISERTVYRDLNALELAGVPYHFDKEDRKYRIQGDYFLPPLQLTLGEAMALSILGSQLAGRGQLPLLEDGWQAVIKIRSQLPPAIREEVAGNDAHVRVEAARVSPQKGSGPYFVAFRKAIAQRRKIRCAYDGGKQGKAPFLFRPYELFFSQRAWYVVGYSEAVNAERTLKLNRLLKVEATDRPYMIPDDWTLEKSLGFAWRMIRGGRRYRVKIRFDREVARNVADTLWHPTQLITWSPDGMCQFECQVDGLDEIVWWVLGYGPHALVSEPAALIERIVQMAAQLQESYQAQKPVDHKIDRSTRSQTAGHP